MGCDPSVGATLFGGSRSDRARHMHLEKNGSTTFMQTSTYEPRPRFWRIRESGGELYFESSPDGVRWDVEMQTQTPFAVGSIRVRFGTRVADTMEAEVGIRVPNYNILP